MARYNAEYNALYGTAEAEVPASSKQTFLRNMFPFSTLGPADLAEVGSTMEWKEFSPRESVIKQGLPGEKFHVIKSGLVKVYLVDEERRETVLGFLGEGDCFGEIALLTGGPTTANIQAVEQTIGLVQNKEAFLRMTQKHPVFHPFFNQLLTQRMRSVYRELLSENPGVAQVEPFLYRKQVGEICSPSQSFCHSQDTLREVTEKMIAKGLSSMVIVDDQNKPAGIVLLSGIARSVLLEGRSPGDSVEAVMEDRFHSIDFKNYFFEALYLMIKHKTNELVVLDEGQVEGILTGFDLLRFRGRETLSLLRNIEEAPTITQLNSIRGEVEKVLRALLTDGALASHTCKIVSEFNDKVVRRVIRLAEDELGSPPSPYAWLGLGSEGRREQTLFTDQDNAILFSSSSSENTLDYFKQFSAKVVEGLNQCGIPLCKGGIMASNPKYFGDIGQWRKKTEEWIQAPALEGKDLIDTYVFLDFRSVSGDAALENELRSHILQQIHENSSFLQSLAQPIVSVHIPIGFFKNFIVEKSGKYRNRLNIKLYGLLPLITCIKILALQQGIWETNTLERIRALSQDKTISADQAEAFEQALETFLTLKIRNNLYDIDQGRDLSNHIDPSDLSTRQKQLLKEAFWAVSQLQKITRGLLKVEDKELGIR